MSRSIFSAWTVAIVAVRDASSATAVAFAMSGRTSRCTSASVCCA